MGGVLGSELSLEMTSLTGAAAAKSRKMSLILRRRGCLEPSERSFFGKSASCYQNKQASEYKYSRSKH